MKIIQKIPACNILRNMGRTFQHQRHRALQPQITPRAYLCPSFQAQLPTKYSQSCVGSRRAQSAHSSTIRQIDEVEYPWEAFSGRCLRLGPDATSRLSEAHQHPWRIIQAIIFSNPNFQKPGIYISHQRDTIRHTATPPHGTSWGPEKKTYSIRFSLLSTVQQTSIPDRATFLSRTSLQRTQADILFFEQHTRYYPPP